MSFSTSAGSELLGPADVRSLAEKLNLRPTKTRGQNFVIEPNTVRRIVRLAGVTPTDVVMEIGPGLGSLTLALLPAVAHVHAIEIDRLLAEALPETVAAKSPRHRDRLTVISDDALKVESVPAPTPTAMVANLPYNVAVPLVLHVLRAFPGVRKVLVMVQREVAERLVAKPGSRVYGVPSVKASWYGEARWVGAVARTVFWPVPNVDSGLVMLERREPPHGDRDDVFEVIDAAFSARRKTLRSALARWAGTAVEAEQILREAGIDPKQRAERLEVTDFAKIAEARSKCGR